MRKTLRASILLLALSCSAYAGNIPNDRPTPPQPATATEITTETAETVSAPADIEATEPIAAEIAFTLLQTVLAIL